MDNQHQKIRGYRDLSGVEIAAINMIKEDGERLGSLCDQLATLEGVDTGWVTIGRRQLQQGIMALVRSVAKPTTF